MVVETMKDIEQSIKDIENSLSILWKQKDLIDKKISPLTSQLEALKNK